jgi:hypothetical protein
MAPGAIAPGAFAFPAHSSIQEAWSGQDMAIMAMVVLCTCAQQYDQQSVGTFDGMAYLPFNLKAELTV